MTPERKNSSASLTIAICTYNRAELLKDCLNSIANQPSVGIEWSVLVVDNNSTDETQTVCDEFVDQFFLFRVVVEKQQGLSYARNRAVAESSSEWIAFIDDDAILTDQWLKTAEEEIVKNRFDAIGGPYFAWHRSVSPPRWFKDCWESVTPNQPSGTEMIEGFPTGGNCLIKRTWCQKVPFATHLGMVENKIAYGEETLFFSTIRSLGASIGWNNSLSIQHYVRPEKYQICWRFKDAFSRGRDNVSVQNSNASIQRLFYRIAITPILFALYGWRLLKGRVTRRQLFLTDFVEYGKTPFANLGHLWAEFKLFFKSPHAKERRE